jgi:branched-chain amino acid transport system permease protein
MELVFLAQQVVNGLVLGGYYLLIALGLSLIFSVGGVVNLAHGAFYTLGAYISVEIGRRLGFGPAAVVSPVVVGLLGIAFERFILRRFYTEDPILGLLVTFGLAMAAEQAIRMVWGAAPLLVSLPPALKGSVIVGDFLFSRYRLMLLTNAARGAADAPGDLVGGGTPDGGDEKEDGKIAVGQSERRRRIGTGQALER